MEMTTVVENFGFTAITWHEVTEKIDFWTIGELLNEKLHLSKYGDGLDKIVFTYIADNHENFREEEIEYDAESKTIFLSLRLDYEKVKNGTKKEVLILMKNLFLTSVFYYYSVGVRDFDFKGFYEDLKCVFYPNEA